MLPMALASGYVDRAAPADRTRASCSAPSTSPRAGVRPARDLHAGPGLDRIRQGHGLGSSGGGRDAARFDGVLTGEVPIGAGLSSSAALEIAAGPRLPPCPTCPGIRCAGARSRSVRRTAGWACSAGSWTSSFAGGRDGHALLIDCRDLALRPVPVPRGTVVAVLDTSTRRGLVDSVYNERRAGCEEAAHLLWRAQPARPERSTCSMRARGASSPTEQLRLARHVVTENARTLAAAEAMTAGDAGPGRLHGRGAPQPARRLPGLEPRPGRDRGRGPRRARLRRRAHDGAGLAGCAVALVAEESIAELHGRDGARVSRGHGPPSRQCTCRARRRARSCASCSATPRAERDARTGRWIDCQIMTAARVGTCFLVAAALGVGGRPWRKRRDAGAAGHTLTHTDARPRLVRSRRPAIRTRRDMSPPRSCRTARCRRPTPTATSSSGRRTLRRRKRSCRTACRKARSTTFTMSSADSKIYPGIARDAGHVRHAGSERSREADRDDQPSGAVHAPGRGLRAEAVRPRHRRAVHRRRRRPGHAALHRPSTT